MNTNIIIPTIIDVTHHEIFWVNKNTMFECGPIHPHQPPQVCTGGAQWQPIHLRRDKSFCQTTAGQKLIDIFSTWAEKLFLPRCLSQGGHMKPQNEKKQQKTKQHVSCARWYGHVWTIDFIRKSWAPAAAARVWWARSSQNLWQLLRPKRENYQYCRRKEYERFLDWNHWWTFLHDW